MGTEIAAMFGLAVVSVGMWTLRVAVAASGRRIASALVAAVEAVVFVLTFSHLVSDLSSPARLGSYAAGVAVGTAIGLFVNERTDRGDVEIEIITPGARQPIVGAVRDRGWAATVSTAEGPDGPVTHMWLTVPRPQTRMVTDLVLRITPGAFVSMRPVTAMNVRRRGAALQSRAGGHHGVVPDGRPGGDGTGAGRSSTQAQWCCGANKL